MALAIIVIIRYIISASNVAVNSFLIYALWKRNKLEIVSYWLIFCLSISDVCFGLFALINESLKFHLKTHCWNDFTCFVTESFELFFASFSATFLLTVAIDRFIHMKFVLRYHEIMTKKRAVILVVLNVIFTCHLIVIARLLPKYQRKFFEKNFIAFWIYLTVLSFIYFLVVMSVSVVYIITYFSIRNRVNSAANVETEEMGEIGQSPNEQDRYSVPNIYNSRRRRPDQEFAVCIMFVIILLLFFEAPNLFVSVYSKIVMLIQRKFIYSKEMLLALTWTYMLLKLNSSLNAVVILSFSRELREFTKRFFKSFVNSD